MEQTNRQTALVTGATSGIGYQLTRLFAKDGYNLVLVARTEEDLHRLSDELVGEFKSIEVTVIPKDLSLPNAALEVYEETERLGIEVSGT
jgi:uncharacterized protein